MDLSSVNAVAGMESSAKAIRKRPFVFAVSGYKNSGKTTLICRLIPELKSRGYQVAVIKHDGHDFVGDVPGTDSFRHREAGACGCAVFSKKRILITREIEADDAIPDEQMLIKAFPKADIILLEGLKDSCYPKYFCRYPMEPLPPVKELADRIEAEMELQNFL